MKNVVAAILVVLVVMSLLVGGTMVWWQRETETLRQQAEAEVTERMSDLRSKASERKRAFARKQGWPWPPQTPAASPEKTLEQAKARIQQRVNKGLPSETIQKIMAEAEEKYGLREKGDEVSFKLRGGLGVQPRISGTLYNITDERVQVDRQWFNKKDIPPTERVHFDPALSRMKIREYTETRIKKFQQQRQAYRRIVRREIMAEHGYSRLPKTDESKNEQPAPAEWVPMKETLDTLWQRWMDTKHKELRQQIFTEHGFVRFRGEWVRPNPWYRLQSALAGEEETEKEE